MHFSQAVWLVFDLSRDLDAVPHIVATVPHTVTTAGYWSDWLIDQGSVIQNHPVEWPSWAGPGSRFVAWRGVAWAPGDDGGEEYAESHAEGADVCHGELRKAAIMAMAQRALNDHGQPAGPTGSCTSSGGGEAHLTGQEGASQVGLGVLLGGYFSCLSGDSA